MSNKKMSQVLKLDNTSYEEAKKDETGYYLPDSFDTFEDFVNFEISALHDNDKPVQSITPLVLNGGITYIIVYSVEE